MAKNRIRGKPKKRTNHPRDSDIARQIERDIEELIKKGIKYVTVNKKQLIPYITFAYAGDMISYIYIETAMRKTLLIRYQKQVNRSASRQQEERRSSQRDNRSTMYYVFGQSYATYYTSGQLSWGVFEFDSRENNKYMAGYFFDICIKYTNIKKIIDHSKI